MHILLTDLLTCPRCGPEFGLVLLGDRIEARRILEGLLGCPNCRQKYPVRSGFGDLRPPPRDPLPPAERDVAPGDREAAVRLAALLGVREGPGYLVLVGEPARHAPALTDVVEGVEVVGVGEALRGWKESSGVSRIAARGALPFYSRRIRGVALDGAAGAALLDEAIRVVGPGSRVVVQDAPEGTVDRLREAGLEPILDEDGVVVAARG